MDTEREWGRLLQRLGDMGSAVVCFSGGVDSTLLLHAASVALPGKAYAFMADIPFLSRRQRVMTERTVALMGLPLRSATLSMDDMGKAVLNDGMRCYHCKDAIFRAAKECASEEGVLHVLDGENVDDMEEDRPGRRAARENGVESPLKDVGLGREEIESLVTSLGLPVKLEKETCLATRIRGSPLDPGIMQLVEEGERMIRSVCQVGELRLRSEPGGFTIEVRDADIGTVLREKDRVVDSLRPLGIRDVGLRPYRSHRGTGELHILAEHERA